MNDETLEVPLPEGTLPDQESVTTQEIPRIPSDPFPDVKLVSPVKVDIPPVHLLGDPIMTMEAPQADETPLYDQIHGPRRKRPVKRPRRRMKTGDKVLAGMGAASIVGITMVYGMVAYGWGGGSMPKEAAPESSRTIQVTTPAATPSDSPTPRHTPSPERKKTSAPAAAPETYLPEPEHSVVVVVAPKPTPPPSPTKTSKAPSAPETTSEAPEPTRTSQSPSASASSSPPASPSPSDVLPSIPASPTQGQ